VTTPAAHEGQRGGDADDAVHVGDTIANDYVIESVLGRGASGVVFAAKRQTDATLVALKVIHPELCHCVRFGRR
jgi:serine/threonine-protein kinase